MNLSVLKHKNLRKSAQKSLSKEYDEIQSDKDILNKYDSDENSNLNSSSSSNVNSSFDDNDTNSIQQIKENKPPKTVPTEFSLNKTITFNSNEYPFIDNNLVKLLNEMSSQAQTVSNFLINYEKKLYFDKSVEVNKFFSSLYKLSLQKLLYIIKENSIYQEIINSFSILNKISSIILYNNYNLLTKNNKQKDDDISQIHSFSLEISYLTIEIYLTIIYTNNIQSPTQFISSSLAYISKYLNIYSDINEAPLLNIKRYIDIIHQLLTGYKSFNVIFTIDQYKDIFFICFDLLKIPSLSFSFTSIIDILCNVISLSNDKIFIDKFIEHLIIIFDDFLCKHSYNDSSFKYFLINKNVPKKLKYQFGEYKCLNGETISLYTYLFLRFYSLLYIKEWNFLENFEKFLCKFFTWNYPSILVCLQCLLYDLIKIKYNVEFCVTLVILTNFYLSFINFISQNEIDLNKKKFFLNLLDVFFNDLLNDFDYFKNSYLCFGYSHIKSNLTKDQQKKQLKKIKSFNTCHCFSCLYSKVQRKNVFYCQDCLCQTNLRLQLIDPVKDDNMNVCGFCNMKNYFESCGIVFDKEKEMQLIEINEEVLEEVEKSRKRLKKEKLKQLEKANLELDLSTPKVQCKELFDKFLLYQDILYKNAFLFLKVNLLNFIRIASNIQNKTVSNNIDISFNIFIMNLISDQKMKNAVYKDFSQSILQFYNVQKERVFNLQKSIIIDDDTIKYFFFFHSYVNFLFAGHWKLTQLIITKGNIHWNIRAKALKILQQFIKFESTDNIFQNFDIGIISALITDASFNIRELSLDILFNLYQNSKIERGNFICVLYQNINENSFLIRKRIITALSDLVLKENEREHLKQIILIFLNKLNDNTESEKIKKMIWDYFSYSFHQNGKAVSSKKKNKNELLFLTVDIFINILSESENICNGNNPMVDNLKRLFDNITKKGTQYDNVIDYLVSKYMSNFNIALIGKYTVNELMEVIQSLNLIKILSTYNSQNIKVYIECICNLITPRKETGNDNNNNMYLNIIIQICCEILTNIISNKTSSKDLGIKTHMINTIENNLLHIILYKPILTMIASIKTYVALFEKGLINLDNLGKLTIQNFRFLDNLKKNNSNNPIEKIPEIIISKSLSLFSYVIYCLDQEQLIYIFNTFLQSSGNEIEDINVLTDYIYELFSYFCLLKPISNINYNSFQSFGFFWIKYPHYLNKSDSVISFIINNITNEEGKIILLRTFYNFFSQISLRCKESQNLTKQSQIQMNNKTIDFGIIHLFFEKFILRFSVFLIEDQNILIRTSTIHLLKLIIDFGNINPHLILPHVFTGLFDYNNEIRFITCCILEKTLQKSKDKFFALMKECLKYSFIYQKENYVQPNLINSFIKTKTIVNNEKNSNNPNEIQTKPNYYEQIENTNENVFDLIYYKLSKVKGNDLSKRLLNSFISCLLNVTSLEIIFSDEYDYDIKECLNKFEFYEFVCKLLGDFKYAQLKELMFVFDGIYPLYETYFCVFKSKFKSFKEDVKQYKIDMKLIFLTRVTGMLMFLFKFLILRYEIFSDDENEKIHLKGWVEFFKEKTISKADLFEEDNNNDNDDIYSDNEDKEPHINKRKKQMLEHLGFVNNECKGIKFYEFYMVFELYIRGLFELQMKRNKKGESNSMRKQTIINYLNFLKGFNTLSLKNMREIIKVAKKGGMKSGGFVDYCFGKFFRDVKKDQDVNGGKKEDEKELLKKRQLIGNQTLNIFTRKRVSIGMESGDSDNKNNNNKKSKKNRNNIRSRSSKHRVEEESDKEEDEHHEDSLDEETEIENEINRRLKIKNILKPKQNKYPVRKRKTNKL